MTKKQADGPPEKAEAEEQEWAKATDISDEDHRDVTLPSRGVKVRIRIVDSAEVARMQMLPDAAGFATLSAKLRSEDEEERKEVSDEELAGEYVNYRAWLAHLAIVDPSKGEEAAPCEWCTGSNGEAIAHPPSLWSPKQTRRLMPQDLEFVVMVALGVQGRFSAVVPFSGDGPPSSSPSPAASGA